MKIRKILVSQPEPANGKSPYFDLAKKYGVEVTFRPFVKVEGISSKEFRQQRINLSDYTAVIFTSRGAIDHYFRLCEENRYTVPDSMRYFCTSESVALYLQKYIVYRKRKIHFGLSGKLDDTQLTQAILKNSDAKFLFPISDVHDNIATALDDLNIDYTKAVMFRTVSNDFKEDEIFDYDLLLFFSPAGVASLKKNFPDIDKNKNLILGALGTKTAQAVKDAGLKLEITAPSPGVPSLPAAVDLYLQKLKK